MNLPCPLFPRKRLPQAIPPPQVPEMKSQEVEMMEKAIKYLLTGLWCPAPVKRAPIVRIGTRVRGIVRKFRALLLPMTAVMLSTPPKVGVMGEVKMELTRDQSLTRRFLRLFSYHLDLEEEVERINALLSTTASARVVAEDQCRLWKFRAETAEAEQQKMRDEALSNVKKIANYEALQHGAWAVPFPEVYTPPAAATDVDGTGNGSFRNIRTARMVQQEAVRKSRADAERNRQAIRDALSQEINTKQ